MDFEKLPESVDDIAAILRHFGIESDDIHNVFDFAVAQETYDSQRISGEGSVERLELTYIHITI